jgi:prolyl oligopeptidase
MVPSTLLLAIALASVFSLAQAPKVAETRRDVVVEKLHSVEVADPYRWLEDQNSPETRAWIDGQNKYTESVLNPLPGKERIRQRLSELIQIDTIGIPFVRGGRYFFSKRVATQDLSVLYMRKGLDAPDEVLVDPHNLSADHTVSAGFQSVSLDGHVLVYGLRSGGEDEVTIHLMEIDARKEIADTLPRARYSGVSITPDKTGIYYSRQTKAGPRVFYHAIGSDPSTDKELFGKGYGPEKIIGAGLSADGRYLTITVLHGAAARKTEVYFQDLEKKSPIVPIVNDIEANFIGTIAGENMYMRTNWNAPNYRVFVVNLQKPSRDNWRELIPEGKSVISGISAVGGKLFVNYLENVQSRVRVYESSGVKVREIQFPTIGSVGGMSGDWERDEAFFAFSSFAQPTTIYRYAVSSGKQEVWAKLNVPVDSENIEVRQVWYNSKDGTRIPMFLAHRKGIRVDGNNPTLLTGYGGFNSSQTTGFSQRAAFWVEKGGVYALPNLRGGGEFGETWHQAGMLGKKQNVFDDFIAAAEWLIKNNYTKPTKLAVSGGSNGGLLVGAAMTQRPDLFQAVVCSYPLLDMVRYHRFLVASYWVPEYGSSENPEQFKYLYAYSPYHHVKRNTNYPAVLFITGDADTRVAPLHARKMAALLQASTGSTNPVLLRYQTKAGHSGGLPTGKIIENLTDEMRFLFSAQDE